MRVQQNEQGQAAVPVQPNEQAQADAAETHAARCYVRQRLLLGLIGEAVARADAMHRLEASLRQQPRRG